MRRRNGFDPMSDRRRPRASLLVLVLTLLTCGCGAKTGLGVPRAPRDGGSVDAPPPIPDGGRPPPDVCIELPPREPPDEVLVSFVSRILEADVLFLVDVTGSMGEEIGQIRARIRDEIIPGIAEQIPDVRFSVARFADYPQRPFGTPAGRGERGDTVYRLEQASTEDLVAVQSAVDRLVIEGGGDGPECGIEALYLTASGESIGGLVGPRMCPGGTIGYPCFAPTGTRIIVMVTDAAMHAGPGGAYPYDGLMFPSHTYDQAIAELRGIGAKVLGLYSGPPGDDGRDHLVAVARDTGAVRLDGSPIVLDIGTDGSSLSRDAVDAVRALVDEVPIDVDALVEDYPGDALDALMFVRGIETVSATPADGAIRLGDRFVDVRPGTRVTFRVLLANGSIERGPEPITYRMTIVLRGDGVTRLSQTVVDVVIPSADGEGCP